MDVLNRVQGGFFVDGKMHAFPRTPDSHKMDSGGFASSNLRKGQGKDESAE